MPESGVKDVVISQHRFRDKTVALARVQNMVITKDIPSKYASYVEMLSDKGREKLESQLAIYAESQRNKSNKVVRKPDPSFE